jgi:hypothetical protein
VESGNPGQALLNVSGSALEYPGQQGERLDIKSRGNRNELGDFNPPFEGLDPLDPVGRHTEPACEFALGEARLAAGASDGGGNGSTSAGESHADRPEVHRLGGSNTVSPCMVRNSYRC